MKLLAAFVADWYYLNLNPTYEPQLFHLESAFVSGGLTRDLVKPYINSLQEIQQHQREAYEQKLMGLRRKITKKEPKNYTQNDLDIVLLSFLIYMGFSHF